MHRPIDRAVQAPAAAARPRHVPGEAGVWLLILGEMTFFTTLFASFLFYRGFDASGFAAAQAELSEPIAVANTLVLLTSSLLVAAGVRLAGQGRTQTAPRLFAAALCCGGAFIALKTLEYYALIERGITLNTNRFFEFYFGLTILHLVHVVFGSLILGALAYFTRKPLTKPTHFALVESGGCFWHMVDLLWIVIFALLYLVK